MNQVELIFTDIRAQARGLPKFATDGSAGLDLRACDEATIPAGKVKKFPMGFQIYMKDPNMCAMIMPRSGLGIKGILPANVLGLIDADYQGELVVHLKNHSQEAYVVQNGDRIAQLAFLPIIQPNFNIVTEFSEITARGEGCFGSTGKR
jgi:dUTP pyrophosphatase